MAYLSCAKDNEYPLLLIFNLIPPSQQKNILIIIFLYAL